MDEVGVEQGTAKRCRAAFGGPDIESLKGAQFMRA